MLVKVWLHYFIGDTEGNNKWLGQYPRNKEGVQRPYRDCTCSFDKLELSNPHCQYIELEDIREGRTSKWHWATIYASCINCVW